MAVTLNKSGEAHLKGLIDAGKYNTDKGWGFSAEDGNALLGDKGDDWARYGSVHLGEDDSATENTKARWKYPAAKAKGASEEVYRAGLVAAKDRAAQNGEKDIEDAASALIDTIDKKEGKDPETPAENRGEGGNEASAVASPVPKVTARTDLPRMMARIFGTPLLVDASKLEVILSALGPRLGLSSATVDPQKMKALFGDDDEGDDPLVPYEITPDGIACIGVDGTLVYKTGWLGALSGLTSYSDVRAAVDKAVSDPSVKGILLEINSYGGEANGCFDLSDAIFAARGAKPLYAVAADDSYSGAFALASAASKLFVSRTSGVGSIGVVCCHIDQSAADKQDGLKYTFVYSGDRKIDGNPHVPLTSPAMEAMQAESDRLRMIFAESVARYRGISVDAVVATQAAKYFGANAVAANLADAVGTPNDALNALRAEIASRAQIAKPPFTAAEGAPATSATSAAEETAQVIDLASERLRITGEAVSTHAEIVELCALASHPDLAAGFIRKSTSIADVRKELQTLRARASDALAVTGHIMPDAGGTDAQQAAAGWTKAFAAFGDKKQGDAK
jgi:ClpP class serine protease